ncbi:uncharacterized protein L199_003038 [Kwoniella botswanensis]|uniref:uncharacterized protein n=1 Tax=Kwoniella botswanensis TaxID=1268659 RepID=UPI00315D1224
MSTRSNTSLDIPLRPGGSFIRTTPSESRPSTSDTTGWRSGQTFHTSAGSFTFNSDGTFRYAPLGTDSRPMYNKAD